MYKRNGVSIRRSRCRPSRGSVLVETVLGVVVLTIFIFGIVELGWYFRDAAALNTFARDYGRYVSSGMTTTEAMKEIENSNHVTSSALLLQNGLSDSNFTAYYSTDSGATFPTTQPVTNDKSGAKNSVKTGYLILVTVTYSHSRITGLFGSGQVPMQAMAVMVRQ